MKLVFKLGPALGSETGKKIRVTCLNTGQGLDYTSLRRALLTWVSRLLYQTPELQPITHLTITVEKED